MPQGSSRARSYGCHQRCSCLDFDENEDRRVRTSSSENNKRDGVRYADTLGKLEHVSMFDLVIPPIPVETRRVLVRHVRPSAAISQQQQVDQVPPGELPDRRSQRLSKRSKAWE